MNKVILVGRLTRDPDVSYTQSGIPHVKFTLAVDRFRSKNAQNNPEQQTADFIPVTAWREQAQLIGNHLQKGRRILVEGKLQVSNYTGQDGTKRTYTDVLLERFEFLDSKRDSDQSQIPSSYPAQNQNQNYIAPPADDYPPDDDGGVPPEQIPF